MKKVQNNDLEKIDWFKVIGFVIIVLFACIGFAFVLAASFSHYNYSTSFTGDYIDTLNKHIDSKILSFKDSSMLNVNKPETYNKYVDSINKYVGIYRYINRPIK